MSVDEPFDVTAVVNCSGEKKSSPYTTYVAYAVRMVRRVEMGAVQLPPKPVNHRIPLHGHAHTAEAVKSLETRTLRNCTAYP